MNLNFDFGIQGKVKYELIDTRTGEVEETRENNMLLDSYLDGIFNSRRGLLDEEIFDMCYLGDSDIAPSRSQLGLQGSILASSSPLEKVEDNLGLLRNNNQLITTFTGHSSIVYSVAFSPDGTKVVSGSYDNTVKVWEADTGNLITTFTGHSDNVESVAFSPDGNYVVSGSYDSTAKVWEADTGNVITTFTGHSNDVYSVAFSPDGNYVVSGSIDNTAKVREANFGLLNTAKMGYKYRFGAGSGTAMLIKEIALRADDYNYYNAEWVARQVPPNPIDKKDYHQLDITWTIEVQSPNIYYTTTIANGQRDGTSIDVDVEIANIALAGIAKYNLSSLDTFFGISGTPQFALGTSNAKKYPVGDENIEPGISLEGIGISGGFIAPFEVTSEPYVAGSYSRTFRVGLESDQGNHADGLGEIILRNSAGDYFGRVLFTPPLDKVNTYRFYFDITFSLNPS